MSTTTGTAAGRHRSLGDQRWQDRAACQSTELNPVDPDWFFPAPEETDKIEAAKTLCAQCPVRRTCLEAALETHDVHGIRGGMTEEEREPLHERVALRLDYSRVEATLTGRDIHLTKPERRAVVLVAYQRGVSEARLAWLLKVSEEHAQKLYRRARRALRHREVEGLPPYAPAEESLARGDFGTVA